MRPLALWSLLAPLILLAGCVSDPPRRPSALDPSNPCANVSPMAPAGSAETSDAVATMDDMPADHTMRADHQQRNVPSPPSASSSAAPESGVVYTCPMHPEVRQPGPGRCPKCGMTLVPIDAGAPATAPSRGSMHHGMSMDGGM